MKKILKNIWILSIFLLWGCTKQVYIPTDTKHIIEYRDSTIYLEKVVEVPVPVEKVVEVMPKFDTLKIETSVAEAECWADTTANVLRGRMKNKAVNLKAKVDTCFIIEYVDKYIEKEVINEVEVPVKYVPKIYHISMYFSIAVIAFIIAYIIYKIKGGF